MLAKLYALAITLALVLYSGASLAKPDTAGQITFLKGTAHVKASTGGWIACSEGSSLRIGDQVRTGKKSRIEIHMIDGSVIRLGSNTILKIDTALVSESGEREMASFLRSGQAYANASKKSNDLSKFEIHTSNAIAGVRGTAFRIDAKRDKSTVVRVYTGAVAVSNAPIFAKPIREQDSRGKTEQGKPCTTPPAGGVKPNRECQTKVAGPEEVTKKQWEEIVAQAMQEVKVGADGKMTKLDFESEPTAAEEEWVSWNKSRDNQP
jgi:hypothetical protein